MTALGREHLDAPLQQYAGRDPELFRELQAKFAQPVQPRVDATVRAMSLAPEVALVSSEGLMTGRGRRVAETIVRPSARPVLIIRDNRATTEFLGPDSQVWAARVQAAQSALDRVIPAVGRVEVGNNPDYTWVGTGWLVADDIIVTNRHVAREFGRQGPADATFRIGTNGGPMSSRIDFLEEDQRLTALEYDVKSILWIAPTDGPDVAFLRVTRAAGSPALPQPIVLAEAVTADDFIAAIGYPARDPRVPDQDLVRRLFGDVYEKKRLAPGQVLNVGADELEHDCSTLGGNSGSALIALSSGAAVGLHFAGQFLDANYAVPASRLRDLLQRVQKGELPSAATVRTVKPPAPAAVVPGPAVSATPGTYTIRLQIPVEITVTLGTAVTPAVAAVTPPAASPPTEDMYAAALLAAREALRGDPSIIDVRLGYRFKRGWITDEQVVVVEVREKRPVADLQRAGLPLIPPQILGVGVDVRTAPMTAQLGRLGIDFAALEVRPRPGQYREPPDLALGLVKEPMTAVFHVSPDSGFPNLKDFLGRVKRHLTATMYEWEPNHISDAIEEAMAPRQASLKMVTQKNTSGGGTKRAVDDMKRRIGDKFEHVWASVGAGRLIPSAYHIKVASRDGEEVWLSSGNWKDSNQADIDPAGSGSTSITPLRQHNREWHAVIGNATLATLFQKYIEFDFDEAQRVPFEEVRELALPDVFIPEAVFVEAPARAAPLQYFKPLFIDRELEIQPLLTPDRDPRRQRIFMAHAIQMIRRATRKVYVENQSFSLLEDDNDDAFEAFFTALLDRQEAEVDVRIIFRDSREFSPENGPAQQKLIERIKKFGLNTDLVKVQRRCHTKGIIVDSSEVLLGSHNLTNAGSLFNRDASLLIRDADVAAYFERIFLFDWNVLATQDVDELVGGMRLALPGEETPAGFRRVALAELLDT